MNEEINDMSSGKAVRQAHKAKMRRIADLQPEPKEVKKVIKKKSKKKTIKKVIKKVVKKVAKKKIVKKKK